MCVERVTLKGRVVRGLGRGRLYVTLYSDEVVRTLGFRPYPGTLNVALDGGYVGEAIKVFSSRPYTIIMPPAEGLAPVRAWRAYLLGLPVYVVRSERTAHGPDVVEVISAEYLRERLGLSDGSEVWLVVLLG